jgi:hypothetical protein
MRYLSLLSLLSIIILILFSSCVTQKKCAKRFPPEAVLVRYDSIVIKDTIIYKDRIITHVIKADTVYRDVIIESSLDVPVMMLENDYAKAKAWINNSKLKLQLEQKNKVIQFKLDSADKEVRHWEYKYRNEKQTVIVEKKYVPKFVKTLAIVGGLFSLLFLGWFGYKIFKFFR